jgi:hypothetical protein
VLLVDKWAARRLRRCKGVGGMQQRGGRRERGRVERPRSLTSGLVMSPRSASRVSGSCTVILPLLQHLGA